MRADHTLGTTLDDAVSTNATGTISGKLRGLVGLVVTLLSRLPASLGQKAKAASFPVTLASDEDALTVTASGTVTADQGVAYKVGDVVTYLGNEYRCLQAHTSIQTWNPVATINVLWALV